MKRLLFFAAIFSVGFFSCKKDRDPKRDRANVTIKLTDAPGAFSAVMLNVKEVVIVTDQGQQTLAVNSGLVNILRYRNGRDTVIAGGDIPAGKIQQIRLVLHDNGNRVIVNGVSQDLTTPSGQTSGVKLNLQETLTPGVAYTIKLDFDVAKSIVLTGNGKYILKPVIRAIADATSGVLAGTISPASAMPNVYAITGTDTVGTMADADGKFYFQGLAAGTYQVRFEPLAPYQVKSVTGVVVSTGQIKDMGLVPMN